MPLPPSATTGPLPVERPMIGARLLPPAPRAGAPWLVVAVLVVVVAILILVILKK
jgi:hypothetical protein